MKKWSEKEEQELLDMLKDGLYYKEIASILNRTQRSVKEKTNKLGYTLNSFITKKEIICLNCGKKIEISARNKKQTNRKFCSSSCSTSYNNKKRDKEVYDRVSNTLKSKSVKKDVKIKDLKITDKKEIVLNYCLNCNKEINKRKKYCSQHCKIEKEYKDFINKWKNGEEKGMSGDYSISGYVRRYIHKKYNNQCSECGWHEKNPYTNKIPLEIEHIDGNYKNNKEENLTLLCPNCHSLTKTYKGANKGNGRKERNKYYLI